MRRTWLRTLSLTISLISSIPNLNVPSSLFPPLSSFLSYPMIVKPHFVPFLLKLRLHSLSSFGFFCFPFRFNCESYGIFLNSVLGSAWSASSAIYGWIWLFVEPSERKVKTNWSQILVLCLRPMLDELISPFQASFIPGPKGVDNVIIVQEAIHYVNNMKGRRCNLNFKIDFEKKYDRPKRLDWPNVFLLHLWKFF